MNEARTIKDNHLAISSRAYHLPSLCAHKQFHAPWSKNIFMSVLSNLTVSYGYLRPSGRTRLDILSTRGLIICLKLIWLLPSKPLWIWRCVQLKCLAGCALVFSCGTRRPGPEWKHHWSDCLIYSRQPNPRAHRGHSCFNITEKGPTIVPDSYNRILNYTRKLCKNSLFQWKWHENLIQYCLVVNFR